TPWDQQLQSSPTINIVSNLRDHWAAEFTIEAIEQNGFDDGAFIEAVRARWWIALRWSALVLGAFRRRRRFFFFLKGGGHGSRRNAVSFRFRMAALGGKGDRRGVGRTVCAAKIF